MNAVLVKARMNGGTFVARAGSGKDARIASCAMGPKEAALYAAAKFFRLSSPRCLLTKSVEVTGLKYGEIVCEVALPAEKNTTTDAEKIALLTKALELHLSFLASLPRGWLAHTCADIGLLNQAYLASRAAGVEPLPKKD